MARSEMLLSKNITITNAQFTPGHHARSNQTLPFVEEQHRESLRGHIKYHKIRHSNHLHRLADIGGVVVMEKIMLYVCVNLLFPGEFRSLSASMSVFEAVETALALLVIECRPDWPDIKAKWDFHRDYFNSRMIHWFNLNYRFCASLYRAVGVNLMRTKCGQIVPVDTFPAMHSHAMTSISTENNIVNIGEIEPMNRRLFAFLSIMQYLRLNTTQVIRKHAYNDRVYLTNPTSESLAATCRALSRTFFHWNFDKARHTFQDSIMMHGYEFALNRDIFETFKYNYDVSNRVILDMLEYHELNDKGEDGDTAEEPRCKRHKMKHYTSATNTREEIHFLEDTKTKINL